MPDWARMTVCVLALGLSSACLAPPPPIVVDTPYGAVRAGDVQKANEVAGLLQRLAPEVRAVLPGVQDRPIDVWVQEELAVYRWHERPESVRGFTLLEEEFRAKRIHLQESGQSPWYLAHELVHALIGSSWATLPGILEEGLGDVVAERLNPEYKEHIRTHRLLNASAFTGGLDVEVAYREPGPGASSTWDIVVKHQRLSLGAPVSAETLAELLRTPRATLHQRWADVPESFYGIAWLLVSRIEERIGLEGLHQLCLHAEAQGLPLVPVPWLEAAADLRIEDLDAEFLASCFDRPALQTALFLQPDAFAELILDILIPLHGKLDIRDVFNRARPVIRLPNQSELRIGYGSGPVYRAIRQGWRTVAPSETGAVTAP